MTLRAEITFTGLFLFAPAGNKLHVILPKSDVLGPGHEHESSLSYEDQSTLKLVEEPLPKHFFIAIDALSGATTVPPLPASIADVGSLIGNKQIKKEKAVERHHPDVHAAITLPAPDDVSPGPTTLWRIPGFGTRFLTNHLKCVWADVQLTDFTLAIEHENGTTKPLTIPRDSDGWAVDFHHIPAKDHPIGFGHPAHHFEAYYPVFDSAARDPKPHLAEKPPVFSTTGEAFAEKSVHEQKLLRAASTFTCMLGRGTLM